MHWTTLRVRPTPLRTCWQADEIAVARGDELIDRLRADDIERVTLVHAGEGESPIEVRAALFEMPDRVVLLGAECGIAGRVLFERQAYWSRRNCIYWINERCVSWPETVGEARRLFARQPPQYQLFTAAEARALFARTDLTGPHTWDQRKQCRFERRRPFPGRLLGAPQISGGATT